MVDKQEVRRQALRDADAEYHRLCMDIQEPTVPDEELRLDELAEAISALTRAVEDLRSR